MNLSEARLAVADCGHRMVADGLVVGTSGNVSVRVGDLLAITPTGVPYDRIGPGDIGIHRLDGTAVDAPLPPTSEMAMHLSVYGRTDARAVVHTHSVAATAVGTVVDVLPSVHYQVAMFGGPVRVAPYATYGTPELAANMAAALDGRTGCLLGNHGTITIGGTLPEAYARALYLEWLCEVWLRARSVGVPRLLDDDEIDRVAAKLRHYGPDARPDPE
ncbi:MAG TPA: class II aldolase/adducin family protein [Micromonosporaceae bacterium]